MPDPLGNSDLQNVVDHQPRRQQDQGYYQYTDCQQPGEPDVIHHCQLRIGGFCSIPDTQRVQKRDIIEGIQLMNAQLGAQIIHYFLKAFLFRCADVHAVIEVVIRQKLRRRPFSGQAQNMTAGIAQEIALRYPHQGKFRGIVIGVQHNSVAQSLGTGETDRITDFSEKSKKLQRVLRQGQLHGRLRQTALHKTGVGRPGFQPISPILCQIQRELIVQFHIAQGNKPPRVRQPGILLQNLGLLLGELHEGSISIAADGDGLLLPHGGQHAGGLPHGSGHHGGQDNGGEDQKRGHFLGKELSQRQGMIAFHPASTSDRTPSIMVSCRSAAAAIRLSWVMITSVLPIRSRMPFSSSITSPPLLESKFPVGSSAKMTSG